MRVSLLLLAALTLAFVAGCQVPEHMHVTEGTTPQNVNTDVRFRTTYYFRVFDYCWSADVALALAAAGTTVNAAQYREIIPETDTLYRYRMTGKSSALFNNIKFESGILRKEQIDPFGTDIVYNGDIGGFLVRNAAEAQAEARRIADSRARESENAVALQRFQALRAIYQELAAIPADSPEATQAVELKAALMTAIAQALAVYTGNPSGQLSKAVEDRLKELPGEIKALVQEATATLPTNQLEDFKQRLAAMEGILNRVTTLIENNKPLDAICPPGAIRRKGFQVMGPEGIKEFDQDERLIMAMFTSAQPLTETLQEYSSRILKPRANPAEQLLPLVRENLRIIEAQNAAERVEVQVTEPKEAAPTANAVFDAALTAFEGR